jgi:hypothetical protein
MAGLSRLPLLFIPVNNNRLVVFRMLFGLIMAVECIGSVFTGRVNELFVNTSFNFSFIGFEWLSFLHGSWMNGYYAVMGIFALMVAAGWWYRASGLLLALLWMLTYLAEKTHYNNHYYLMVLLCWIMVFMPAHRRLSVDAWQGRVATTHQLYRWQHLLWIGQIWIVYTCAAIAKMNLDWLQAMPLKLWMYNHARLPLIGPLFLLPATPWLMAYFGLLFDLLVVPGLLWRKTRKLAFWLGVFFHLSNSILFGIGTFPYLAIALCIFFAPSEWLDKVLARYSRRTPAHPEMPLPPQQPAVLGVALVYLIVQLCLPIRHWFIKGNVNWTEEGHRMAWRMMLRSKSGTITFRVLDKRTNREWLEFPSQVLSQEQAHDLMTRPDLIWQYAQRLKKQYQARGIEPMVFAEGCAALNGKPCVALINPRADLAAVSWNYFGHNHWITDAY